MNNLKPIRKRVSIAQWGLAAKARVSPQLVGAIEKWDYVPNTDVKGRIADALGVAIEEVWPEQSARAVLTQQVDTRAVR